MFARGRRAQVSLRSSGARYEVPSAKRRRPLLDVEQNVFGRGLRHSRLACEYRPFANRVEDALDNVCGTGSAKRSPTSATSARGIPVERPLTDIRCWRVYSLHGACACVRS